jgi:hypothetical protein
MSEPIIYEHIEDLPLDTDYAEDGDDTLDTSTKLPPEEQEDGNDGS